MMMNTALKIPFEMVLEVIINSLLTKLTDVQYFLIPFKYRRALTANF